MILDPRDVRALQEGLNEQAAEGPFTQFENRRGAGRTELYIPARLITSRGELDAVLRNITTAEGNGLGIATLEEIPDEQLRLLVQNHDFNLRPEWAAKVHCDTRYLGGKVFFGGGTFSRN